MLIQEVVNIFFLHDLTELEYVLIFQQNIHQLYILYKKKKNVNIYDNQKMKINNFSILLILNLMSNLISFLLHHQMQYLLPLSLVFSRIQFVGQAIIFFINYEY